MAPTTIPYIEKDKQSTLAMPSTFGTVKVALLHQALTVYKGNKARGIAHTKTRAEVSGTGKKPWKQKGTGRARHGSMRSPIWVGGGITFGPRNNKNPNSGLTQKENQLALNSVIRLALDAKRLIVVSEIPAFAKTKEAVAWIAGLPIEFGRIVLIDNDKKNNQKAFANIPFVTFQTLHGHDLVQMANSDWLVVDKKAFETLSGSKSETTQPEPKTEPKKEIKPAKPSTSAKKAK